MTHRGQLTARIFGEICTFEGETWCRQDPAITRALNEATGMARVADFTIDRPRQAFDRAIYAGHPKRRTRN